MQKQFSPVYISKSMCACVVHFSVENGNNWVKNTHCSCHFFRLCSPSAVNKASRIVSRAIPLPAKTFIYWIGYGPCENSQRRTFLSLGSFLSEKEIIIITRHGEKRETHKFFCARLCVYDAGRYVVIIAQNASLMFTIIIFDDTDMYYSLHEKHNNSLFF